MSVYTVPEWLSREGSLIGAEAVGRLCGARVLLFGCGGVGGYTAEALIRAGVGSLYAVDFDVVSESNLNRQIIATVDVIGCKKVELLRRRALSINPDIVFNALDTFVDAENADSIIAAASPDFICDAVDNVTAKLAIISSAKARSIPVISSMGTGNKLDPSRFRITDISKTQVCPLARVMRRELKARNIEGVDVLWSDEPPVSSGSRVPASVSFVPSCAGLMIGGYIIKRLAGV